MKPQIKFEYSHGDSNTGVTHSYTYHCENGITEEMMLYHFEYFLKAQRRDDGQESLKWVAFEDETY